MSAAEDPRRSTREAGCSAGTRNSRTVLLMTLLSLLLLLPLQQPYALMEVGDPISGTAESPLRFDKLTVNNQGLWRAECTWTGGLNEKVILQNGALHMDWRQLMLDGPGMAQWNALEGWELGNLGGAVQTLQFVNTPGALTDNEGMYYENLHLLQLEGDPVLDPNAPLGAEWTDWRNVRYEDGGIAVTQAVYDVSGVGEVECLVRIGIAPDGTPTGVEEILVQEGDLRDGVPVSGFRTDHQSMDLNAAGDFIHYAVLASGSGGTNTIIMLNDDVLAREGSPSPVPGIDFGSLDASSVAVNNFGEHAFSAYLDSTTIRDVIVVNGAAAHRYGDALPDIAPYVLSYLRHGNVDIADTGDVLWHAEITDPNPDTDEALFLNDRVLVRKGVTQIHGSVVASFALGEWGMFLTDDGRRAVFEATLADGSEGLYAVDLDPGLRLLPLTPAVAGASNEIRVAGAQPGAQIMLAGSSAPGSFSISCPGGSVSLDLGQPARKLALLLADANGHARKSVPVPGALAGTTWYLQALDRARCEASNRIQVQFQ